MVAVETAYRIVDAWGNVDFFLTKFHLISSYLFPIISSVWFHLALTGGGLAWIALVAVRAPKVETKRSASTRPEVITTTTETWADLVGEGAELLTKAQATTTEEALRLIIDSVIKWERSVSTRLLPERAAAFMRDIIVPTGFTVRDSLVARLDRRLERLQYIAALERGAGASQPAHIFHLGLCWRIGSGFLTNFKQVDIPTEQELTEWIIGPFCPECGRLLVNERSDYYTMEPQCGRCGFKIDMQPLPGGLGIHDAKVEVYKEAQRLSWKNQPFPVGPCQVGSELVEYQCERIRGLREIVHAAISDDEHKVLRVVAATNPHLTDENIKTFRNAERTLNELGWRVEGGPKLSR